MINKDGLLSKGKQVGQKGGPRKGLGRYIKIGALAVGLLLVIAYNILLMPPVFEKIVKAGFEKQTNGKISLHVLKSSLLRGFAFENIEILSGPDFDARPLLKIDRFNLYYSVYGFFAGDFGLHELGLYNPRVYLFHKNGVWNVSTLMKKSDKPPVEKEEKTGERGPGLSLPVKVRGFVKFVLQNFTMTVTDLDHGKSDSYEAGLKDFTLKTYVVTNKFSYLPYSLEATGILKSVVVNLDPQKTIDIYFKNNDTRVKSPLDLHWLLTFDNDLKKEGFYSRLVVGHQDIPVEYKGRHLLPLNFGMDYDIKYDPAADKMDVNFFRLQFLTDTWINLAGAILNPANPEKTNLNLKITKSDIDIGKIYPYFKAFKSDSDLSFKGHISLAPLSIVGPLDNLNLDGRLNLRKLEVDMGSRNANIDNLDLSYSVVIDRNIRKAVVPMVRLARVKWEGVFNDSPLGAEIEYTLNEKVNAHVYIKRFNPGPFSSDQVAGLFNVDFRVRGKNEKNLSTTIDVSSPGFTYYVGRGISGVNQLNLLVRTDIQFPGESFSTLQANSPEISFSLKNDKGKKAFALNATLGAFKSPEDIKGKFNIAEMSLNLKNLKPTLPGAYQEKIESYAENSEKDIRIKGATVFAKNGDLVHVENTSQLFVDDLDINDIVFKTNVTKNTRSIKIAEMTLKGLNNALDAYVAGNLRQEYREDEVETPTGAIKKEKVLAWVPNVEYSFKLGKKERTRIVKANTIAGFFDLGGSARENLVKGRLSVKDFYYDNGNFTRINDVNVDFPFEHDLRYKKKLNLTAANKERLIRNFAGNFNFNFTVDSVEIPNPSRIKEPLKIIYPGGGFSGLSAAMRYKDNVFEMPMMQIFMLNGLITVQDTVFNVGRGKMSEMQYRTLVQIKDIDLKQLIAAEKARSIKDGKISADMLFTAPSLKRFVGDMSGYVSIYKIGRQFAQQGVKIVMPDSSPLVNLVVDEWTIVHKFDLELKEGLAYVKILYTKGTFGNIIGLDGNEIAQERRPIDQLFQKAGEEVKVYQGPQVMTTGRGQSE